MVGAGSPVDSVGAGARSDLLRGRYQADWPLRPAATGGDRECSKNPAHWRASCCSVDVALSETMRERSQMCKVGITAPFGQTSPREFFPQEGQELPPEA